MRALTTNTISIHLCQIVLDLLDITFAELFYGSYKEHLETQDSQWIITITQESPHTLMVILIIIIFLQTRKEN